MYEQSLYKILPDHVKPKILNKNNKFKKWKYGYDEDHEMVVISKTGEIGEIYEIQNLVIALPKATNVVKSEGNKWVAAEYPKELKNIKTVFDWKNYSEQFKENGMIILKKNFKGVKKVIGFLTKTSLLILLVLSTCTCNGPKLILGSQILESPIDYSIYSGRLAKQTKDVMVCHISRTDVQAFHSWRQGRLLTWQPYQAIHGLGFCPNLEPMRRRCSQIKLYPLVLTTRFSLNRFRTEWTGPKPNLPIVYPHPSLPVEDSIRKYKRKRSRVLIPRLTGKTRAITPMMGKNSNYSSTMRAVSGKGRTTSSTTGGLPKQR